MCATSQCPGSACASHAVFGASPKTLSELRTVIALPHHSSVPREAHDTAGEAPAFPGVLHQ